MEYRALLDSIEKLLLINEGVSILDSVGNDEHLRITFQVRNPHSRLIIISVAANANVILDQWAHFHPGSVEANADPDGSVRYRFRNNDAYEDAIDNFCWLGAHLTWLMYKSGVIDSNTEKHYCEIFDATSRSA